MSEEGFSKEELLNWIETQPELDYLRRQANKTKCDYRLNEKTKDRRIRPIPRTNLPGSDEESTNFISLHNVNLSFAGPLTGSQQPLVLVKFILPQCSRIWAGVQGRGILN